MENRFQVLPEDIERKVTSRTKAILIGYPNNPTGAVMPREELEKIAVIAEKNNLIVKDFPCLRPYTYFPGTNFLRT